MTSKLWKAIGGATLRHLCTVVGGYLIAKGFATTDQATALQSQVEGAAAAAVPLVWSWCEKVLARLEAEARGQLPADASAGDIRVRMAEIGWARVLFGIRGKAERDPVLDQVLGEVLALKSRVADLESKQATV